MLISEAVARGVSFISPDTAPSAFQGKVAIFGDSVSTYGGVVLINGQNPGLDASYTLSQDFNILSTVQKIFPSSNVVNISRGGMTTTEALTGNTTPGLTNPFGDSGTITQWILDNSPNKIVLRYGLADAVITSNSTTTLNNLQTIIDFAVTRGIEVILIGVNPAAPNGTAGNPEYYPAYYSNLQEANAAIINTGIINKAVAQGLKYANPRVLTIPIKSMPDGIHPYRNFGGKITQEILRQLRSQLAITVDKTFSFNTPFINTSASEGATVTFSIKTSGVANGTVLYWASSSDTGANVADINSPNPPLGNVVINNNTGTVVNVLANDTLNPETDESFYIDLYETLSDRDSFSNQLVYSNVVTIANYSPIPTYYVVPNVSYVEEGNAIVFNVSTSNVVDGTNLYWNLTGTVNAQDFVGGANSNVITIFNNLANVTLTLANDATTEGGETITFVLRTGSNTGPIVYTTDSVIVGDLSADPLLVEFMVVGGGGGGGSRTEFSIPLSTTQYSTISAGGGGAGGFLCGSANVVVPLPIVVGAGGAGQCAVPQSSPFGSTARILWQTNGTESCFGSQIVAFGGGRGGSGYGGANPYGTTGRISPGITPTRYYLGIESTGSFYNAYGCAGGSGGGAGAHAVLTNLANAPIPYFCFDDPTLIGQATSSICLGLPAPSGNPGGGGHSRAACPTPPTATYPDASCRYAIQACNFLGGGGGGGGGACTAGTPGCMRRGGAGGQGCEWPVGSGCWYGGGGGGGVNSLYPMSPVSVPSCTCSVTAGSGGLGGGGAGSFSSNSPSIPGNAVSGGTNTGGGGGGAGGICGGSNLIGFQPTPTCCRSVGGRGGSGMVIIRYPLPQRALGGLVTCSGGYVYHCYTSSGCFCPQFNYTATCISLDLLVVGGGAGGGDGCGGGGGAGALICAPLTAQTSGTLYCVVVGAGGTGISPATSSAKCGFETSLVSIPLGICIVAKGGGYGGSSYISPAVGINTSYPGTSGGSGGGASGWTYFQAGCPPIAAAAVNTNVGPAGPAGTCLGSPGAIGYTNRGGYGIAVCAQYCTLPFGGGYLGPGDRLAGGGGGAGEQGRDACCSNSVATNCNETRWYAARGGAGLQWLDGNYYSGGGGGAPGGFGTHACGGGGRGSCCSIGCTTDWPSATPIQGAINSGGGGGGGIVCTYGGGCGGSGIVVIKYQGSVCKAIGGTRCVIGGNTYHYFCSSGCFQIV